MMGLGMMRLSLIPRERPGRLLAEPWTAMIHSERVRLLFGPYEPPPLKRGDWAVCLLRGCDVIVTGWTDAPVPWPRCRCLDGHGGGSGLLVEEELARAVMHEAAAAVMHWWGVSAGAVWRWRKVLGVGRMGSEGSRRLIQAAAERGAAVVRGRELPPEQVELRRANAIKNRQGRFLWTGYHGPRWTAEELALLGVLPDDVVAVRIGRTANAVRIMRGRLMIGGAGGGSRKGK
jgi:hypothetical protein